MADIKDKFLKPMKPTDPSKPLKAGEGSLAVKMPRAKKMPSPFAKPSLFFKKEDFASIKHPSIEKLRAFLEKNRGKK